MLKRAYEAYLRNKEEIEFHLDEIMTAKEFHVDRVVVLLVENVYRPLAGDITSWERIKKTDVKYKTKDNFLNYCHEGMTGYSKFCNSDSMIIKI